MQQTMKVIMHENGGGMPHNYEDVDDFSLQEEPDGDWVLYIDGECVWSDEFAPQNVTVRRVPEDAE